jgi:predicted Zn-ribbon and HTH transcriptional regulator
VPAVVHSLWKVLRVPVALDRDETCCNIPDLVNEDEFRLPLQRRIATLRGLRDELQEQLRELHHELNSVDRRIEAADEMYRREFAEEPPSVASALGRRASRIRRSEVDQPPWREAVLDVLQQADGPLHAKEIWRRLEGSGFQTSAVDPLRSVVAIAVRSEDKIQRVGPNTFALNGGDQEQEPSVEDVELPWVAAEEGSEQ